MGMGVGMGVGMGMGMGAGMGAGMGGAVPLWVYQQQKKQLHEQTMRAEGNRQQLLAMSEANMMRTVLQTAVDCQKLMDMSAAAPSYFF